MTLRSRTALLVGVMVALAVGVGALITDAIVRSEQYGAIDDFLLDRLSGIERFAEGGRAGAVVEPVPATEDTSSVAPVGPVGPVGAAIAPRQVDIGTTLQVNRPDGSLVLATNPEIALDVPDAVVEAPELRTVTIDGERYRVAAATGPEAVVVQIARSLAETDATVASIRWWTWGVGLTVTIAAVVLGWWLARRLAEPLERLTAAADGIARSGRTDPDVVGSPQTRGPAEVGRLADSFRRMLDALRTSQRQQQQLVGDAGHEMRTPLTTLRTNAEMLASGKLDADDRAAALATIRREIDELTNLTNELVELAGDPAATEAPTAVDVLEIVSAAVDRARARHRRPVTLTGEHVPTLGQPARLDRAVTNLLDNAVKFSPDGTPIDVELTPGRVSVRDHGSGIDPADRNLVFDRFYRSEGARTLPGSGLGLSIVAQVAADHGGRPFVDSASDGGAIVGFTFAVRPVADPQGTDRPRADPPDRHPTAVEPA